MRGERLAILLLISLASTEVCAEQYFPENVLDRPHKGHQFTSEWYSKQLKGLEEPSLFELSTRDAKVEVYRFTWLRSFHHPIAIRLEILTDGAASLTSKMGSGQAGYEPGKLIVNRTIRVTELQVQTLEETLSRLDFWNLPTIINDGLVHLDGAQWILEGVKDGRYHVVDRWFPDTRDPLRDFELALVTKFARLRILPKEIY